MKNTTSTILAAAVTGLLMGSTFGCASPQAGTTATQPSADKHACKGLNDCSGKGGCASGNQNCAGRNTCQGKGGCATAKSSCKGHNDCKGLGGCKTSTNSCLGKNSCKNKGGCAVPHRR